MVSLIVQDQKDKNLSMKLFLALYKSKKFNKSSYNNSYAVHVLLISNIKCCSTALNLADKKEKVHLYDDYEVDKSLELNLTHKRFKLFKLFLCECRLPEFHRVVRLQTNIIKRNYTISVFVDAFIQMIKVCNTICD